MPLLILHVSRMCARKVQWTVQNCLPKASYLPARWQGECQLCHGLTHRAEDSHVLKWRTVGFLRKFSLPDTMTGERSSKRLNRNRTAAQGLLHNITEKGRVYYYISVVNNIILRNIGFCLVPRLCRHSLLMMCAKINMLAWCSASERHRKWKEELDRELGITNLYFYLLFLLFVL